MAQAEQDDWQPVSSSAPVDDWTPVSAAPKGEVDDWTPVGGNAEKTSVATPKEKEPSVAADVGKGLITGGIKGGANLAASAAANTNPITGIPFDVAMGTKYLVPAVETGAKYLAKDVMGDKEYNDYAAKFVQEHPELAKYDPATLAEKIPSPADLVSKLATAAGHPLPEPETAAGRIAEGVPEFAGLGGLGALKAAIPAVGFVTAPEVVKALGGNEQAQFWGGIAGAGAGMKAMPHEAPKVAEVKPPTDVPPPPSPTEPEPPSAAPTGASERFSPTDMSVVPDAQGFNIHDSQGLPVASGFDSADEARQHIEDMAAEKNLIEPNIPPLVPPVLPEETPAPIESPPPVEPPAAEPEPPPVTPPEPPPVAPEDIQKHAAHMQSTIADILKSNGLPDVSKEAAAEQSRNIQTAMQNAPERTPNVPFPASYDEPELTAKQIKNLPTQAGINKSQAAKTKNIPPPNNIFESIAQAGGLKDEGNWLKNADMRNIRTPNYGRLYNPKGMSYDDALQHAMDKGWINPETDNNNPSQSVHQNLFDALERENDKPTRKRGITDEDAYAQRYGTEPDETPLAHETETAAKDFSPDNELERELMQAHYPDEDDLPPYDREHENDQGAPSEVAPKAGEAVQDQGRPALAGEPAREGTKVLPSSESGTGRAQAEEFTNEGNQAVIPGAERITDRQLQERQMEGGSKAKVAQKPADEGLFDVAGRGQGDLLAQEELGEHGEPGKFQSDRAMFDRFTQGKAGEDMHNAIRDYLIGRGKETGNEHLVIYDSRTKSVMESGTSGQNNKVSFSPEVKKLINDPNNDLAIHHNHPADRALSNKDLQSLAGRGVGSIVAHTHDGNFSSATLSGKAREFFHSIPQVWALSHLRTIGDSTFSAVHEFLERGINRGILSKEDAVGAERDIANRSLDRAGIIQYSTSHNMEGNKDFHEFVENAIKQGAKSAQNAADAAGLKLGRMKNGESGQRGVGTDRLARSPVMSHEEGMSELFRHSPEESGGVQGEGGRNAESGQTNNGGKEESDGLEGLRNDDEDERNVVAGGNETKGFSERTPEDAKREWLLRKPITAIEGFLGQKLKGTVMDKAAQSYVKLIQPELVSPISKRFEARTATYKVRLAEAKDNIAKMGEDAQRTQQKWGKERNYQNIDDLQRGIINGDKSPAGDEFARARLDATSEEEAKVVGVEPSRYYRENYFPGMWKDPEKAQAFFRSPEFLKKFGNDWFNKEKKIPFISEGIKAGLEPEFHTKEEFVQARLVAGADLMERMRLLKNMQDDGMATRAGAYSIDKRTAATQDMLTKTKAKLKAWNDKVNDPKQPEFDFANPIVRKHAVDLQGRIDSLTKRADELAKEKTTHTAPPEVLKSLLGNSFRVLGPDNKVWMIHNDNGALWKNAMDIAGDFGRGLRGNQGVTGSAYRLWMAGKNTWVPLKLAASLFHPLHVATIHLATGFATAAENSMKGGSHMDSVKAIGESLKDAFGIQSMIRGATRGENPYLKPSPENRQTMEEGGYRPQMSETELSQGRLAFYRALDQKEFHKLPIPAAQMALRAMASPIFEHWIPNVKTQAYLQRCELAVKRDPSLASDENTGKRSEVFTQIRKDTERTYGEMNYDNLFWNKSVKDAFQASFLSAGWKLAQLNYYRGLAEPAKLGYEALKTGEFNPKQASYNMLFSYVYGGMALTMGAIIARQLTGQPSDSDDMVFPRTGEKAPDGTDIRMKLPFFNNEAMALAHDYTTKGLLGGITSFVADQTLWKNAWNTINNRDYYGKPLVRDFTNLHEVAHAAWDSVSPITFSNMARAESKGSNIGKDLAYTGLSLAPSYAGQSAFVQKVTAKYDEENPSKGTGYQDYLKKEYKQAKTTGDTAKMDDLRKQMSDEGITPKQVGNIGHNYSEPFVNNAWRKLTPQDQADLIKSATPEEKQKFMATAKPQTRIMIRDNSP
jgi:hypothetical protein